MNNPYELGNLIFGNSRGPFGFPDRNLVESQEWSQLLNLLQMNPYCIMGDYYEGEKRTNGLLATEYGGYQCKDDNGSVIFELFPYWWNGCSCGTDEKNYELEDKITKMYLSENEENDYYEYLVSENELSDKQKMDFERLKLMMDEATREIQKQYIEHEKDCLLLKHNFIYMPGTEEEFWIDWYKYPFRDSHMSKPYSADQIKHVWMKCSDMAEEKIKKQKSIGKESQGSKKASQTCILCGMEIEGKNLKVCDKCASEYRF